VSLEYSCSDEADLDSRAAVNLYIYLRCRDPARILRLDAASRLLVEKPLYTNTHWELLRSCRHSEARIYYKATPLAA
jgi:hypothetical protein